MTIEQGRGVIFDLDGVLVDTGEFHRLAWHDLAERDGFPFDDETFRRTFGMPNERIIPQLVDGVTPEAMAEMSQWKESRYRDRARDGLVLLDGVEALLADLRREGFRTAVATSTPRVNFDFMTERLAALRSMDAVVTGDEISEGKPAPDIFLKAAQMLGLDSTRCVVVEDAVQGVEAGKAAGMRVLAFTTTREASELSQADRIVGGPGAVCAADFFALLD